MRKIILEEKKCPQNHRCPAVNACPFQALTQEGNKAPVVDNNKCTVCGLCVKSCGRQALQIIE